ncbi:MAG: hypothetical protein KA061_08830 [Bacteroidales bacterium]|jgi:hypothetical protein|nr:hypothetical protein [Bacteroidales bacterium]
MANKLDPMVLKQILTLRKEGWSNRKIVLTSNLQSKFTTFVNIKPIT